MRLENYNDCSFAEKRIVLRTFWSARPHESDRINAAAREYGPVALIFIAVVTVELMVIAVLLEVLGSGWVWLAAAATVLSAWSVWWTRECQRHLAVTPRTTT